MEYQGTTYKVIGIDGNQFTIQNPVSGDTRQVSIYALSCIVAKNKQHFSVGDRVYCWSNKEFGIIRQITDDAAAYQIESSTIQAEFSVFLFRLVLANH